MQFYLWDKFPEMKLQDQRPYAFMTLLDHAKLHPKGAIPFTIPPALDQNAISPHSVLSGDCALTHCIVPSPCDKLVRNLCELKEMKLHEKRSELDLN